jgi:IclR family transcriptional regulator, pca regulon regulatory protein
VVDQELEDGLRSAAAPIVDASGALAAAMNVSVHASRVSLADLRRSYVPQLVATARQISADLQRLGVSAQRRLR